MRPNIHGLRFTVNFVKLQDAVTDEAVTVLASLGPGINPQSSAFIAADGRNVLPVYSEHDCSVALAVAVDGNIACFGLVFSNWLVVVN